mgnify:CR=1 FL=1|tara:strand:- start:537 stop:845 length:309 start_codon:yes stop_codon:yes gene_type:complete
MIEFYSEDKELIEDLGSNKNIYIFFYSPSCDPCKKIYPEVLEFGKAVKDIVYFIHEEQALTLQQQLNVTAYPSIVRIKNRKVLLAGLGINEVKKIIDDGKSN